MYLTLSPGVSRFKNVVFEKNWKITNLANLNAPAVSFLESRETDNSDNDTEPQIIEMYFTDMEGKRIEEIVGEKVKLVVKTENCTGKHINLNLSNPFHEFYYQGSLLEDDVLENYQVKSDSDEIELEIDKE
jgi:hypothetical protein